MFLHTLHRTMSHCVMWAHPTLGNTGDLFVQTASYEITFTLSHCTHYHTTHTHITTPSQCAFLIWCMVPMANNGSQFIYHRFIKRFVKEHEKDFEDAISVGTQLAKDATKKGGYDSHFSIAHSNTTASCVGQPPQINSLYTLYQVIMYILLVGSSVWLM